MEFLTQNWWYLFLIGGFVFMMFRGGGCCGGGHSHSGNDSDGHDYMGHNLGNGQHNSGQMDNQIEMVLDPECGMTVDPMTAIKQNVDGKTYYFCSEACRSRFVRRH